MSNFTTYFNENLDGELMDELGDDVIFIPAGGTGIEIKGAFVNSFYDAASNSGIGVESSSPAIECLDRDVVNASGGKIIRNGITYDIVGSPQPDGTGITLLVLRNAQ